jgi:hypothetical protein
MHRRKRRGVQHGAQMLRRHAAKIHRGEGGWCSVQCVGVGMREGRGTEEGGTRYEGVGMQYETGTQHAQHEGVTWHEGWTWHEEGMRHEGRTR